MANGRNGRVTRVVGHDNKRICDAQGRLEEGPFDLGKMWKSSDSDSFQTFSPTRIFHAIKGSIIESIYNDVIVTLKTEKTEKNKTNKTT